MVPSWWALNTRARIPAAAHRRAISTASPIRPNSSGSAWTWKSIAPSRVSMRGALPGTRLHGAPARSAAPGPSLEHAHHELGVDARAHEHVLHVVELVGDVRDAAGGRVQVPRAEDDRGDPEVDVEPVGVRVAGTGPERGRPPGHDLERPAALRDDGRALRNLGPVLHHQRAHLHPGPGRRDGLLRDLPPLVEHVLG